MSFSNTAANSRITLVDAESGKATDLGVEGIGPQYVSSGHVLFVRDGAIYAAEYSRWRKRITTPPRLIAQHVSVRGNRLPEMDASRNGTLVFIAGEVGAPARLVAVDFKGTERMLSEPNLFGWPKLSPDGKHVAVEVGTGAGTYDIWMLDLAGQTLSRLTSGFTGIRPFGWTAEGRRIAYIGVPGNFQGARTLTTRPWDLSGAPSTLTTLSVVPEDASTGGQYTAIRVGGYGSSGDIWVARADSQARPFITSAGDDETPQVSPDGSLLAYASDETGQYEIYVRALSGAGGRLQVSPAGGSEPHWSHDGKSLFYRGASTFIRATLQRAPELAVVRRDTLLRDIYRRGDSKAVQYDVFPGDGAFLVQKDLDSRGGPTVILNWQQLLNRTRVP